MKTNHILALLALISGLAAAFTSFPVKNDLYPTWKYESERIKGGKVKYISATHLADLLYRKDQGIVLVDLRADTLYERYHIPSALQYKKWSPDPGQKKSTFVVYGLDPGSGIGALSDKLPGKVYALKGGMEQWYSLVLFPDFAQYKVRNREALEHILRRSRYFGGSPENTRLLNIYVRQSHYREGC